MTTKNLVPRATGEGSLGTSAKKWGSIYADNIVLQDGETLATKISSQNSRITTAEGTVTSMEGTVTTLSGDVTSLYSSVDELSSGKANKATTLAGYGITDGNFQTDLLWTNASQNSGFAPQTISLDLSSYKYVYILAKSYAAATLGSNETSGYLLPKGTNLRFGDMSVGSNGAYAGTIAVGYRIVSSINDTGITFGTSYYFYTSSSQARNDVCVPIKIYGVK